MDIIVSIVFLILLGLAILKGRYVKAGVGETPLIYKGTAIQFFLNVAFLLFLGLSLFLVFFYSWKLFLILILIGFGTEALIIVPLLEKGLYILLKPAPK